MTFVGILSPENKIQFIINKLNKTNMKTNYFLKSLFMALVLVFSVQAYALETEVSVKMTYIDEQNPDVAYYDEVQGTGFAYAGYNKIDEDGYVGLAFPTWKRNWLTLVQVDVSSIEGTITGVNFSIEGSGSTDSKRSGQIAVGVANMEWKEDATWNSCEATSVAFTRYGETVSLAKSADVFTETTFDISAAFVGTNKKVVTLFVLGMNPGGIKVQNPKVTVSYTPADAKSATYTVYFLDNNEGENIKAPETRTGSVGQTLTPTDADKASFTSADGSKKYIYSSYNAESSVTEDGSAELYIYYNVETVETGINQVSASKVDNQTIYNLNGQRVGASYKGVVVKNGKKFLNR